MIGAAVFSSPHTSQPTKNYRPLDRVNIQISAQLQCSEQGMTSSSDQLRWRIRMGLGVILCVFQCRFVRIVVN